MQRHTKLTKTMVTIAKNLSSKLKLNDGKDMPLFGLGVYEASSGDNGPAEKAVTCALKKGYKMIDTATLYRNEADVGAGLKKSGMKREDVFLVTKLMTNGYDSCKKEVSESLKQMDCGYIDLYLIHSPSAGAVVDSYKAMMECQKQGLIRSIGVSNFGIHHLEGLKEAGMPTPAVNQIELHPWMKRTELVEYCRQNNIALMGYSPLVKAQRLNDPIIVDLAKKLKKTVGQVLIRYSVQMGYITIPKTVREERLEENADVFDWSIPEQDMAAFSSLPDTSCTWNPTLSKWSG